MGSSGVGALRVLFVIGQLGRGGAERQLYELLRWIRPNAFLVSLSSGGSWAEPIRQLGIPMVELERRGHADWRRLLAVRRAILDFSPDIVHIFTDGPSGLYGRIAALLARHSRVVVGDRRHASAEPTWYRVLKRVLNRFVSLVITNSESNRNYLIRRNIARAEQVVCIPNGINVSFIERTRENLYELWRPPKRYVVGFVGRLAPVKRPELFVRAAAEVSASRSDVGFILVGDGPMRNALVRLCDELHIAPEVRILGERDDVSKLLPSFDLLMLTSRSEGMPNVVMEAMRAGVPTVAPPVGACAELLLPGPSGVLVSEDTPTAFARTVAALLDDDDRLVSLGRAARSSIGRFSTDRMAQSYFAAYRRVLTGRRAWWTRGAVS